MHTSQNYIISLLLCGLISIHAGLAQKLIETTHTLKIDYYKPSYPQNQGYVRMLVPASFSKRQTLLKTDYSIPPDRMHYDEAGLCYAEWDLRAFDTGDSILVRNTFLLMRYDLQTALIHKRLEKTHSQALPSPTLSDAELAPYLQHEPTLQKNSQVMQEAALPLKGDKDLKTLENILGFVVEHLKYHNFSQQERSAKKALKQGRGDCTEYSELMVALCRAHHIPARVVVGTVIKPKGNIGWHNWVEVYLKPYGWVPFDPTHADGARKRTDFYRMENKYVYYSLTSNVYAYYRAFYGILELSYKETWQDLLAPRMQRLTSLYNQKEAAQALCLIDTLQQISPQDYRLYLYKGMILARQENYGPAWEYLQLSQNLAHYPEEKMAVHYALANYYALKEESGPALMHLQLAIELGFQNSKHLREDEDLSKIRDLKEFKELVRALEETN